MVALPASVGAVVVLNLQSYAAGNDLWNRRLPSSVVRNCVPETLVGRVRGRVLMQVHVFVCMCCWLVG